MARVPSTWYAGSPSTTFSWATTDNDKFDRELDLYNLAQALEQHTHENGKGLPVGRLADQSILASMYKDGSIPTSAYANLSVTNAKIADGTIADVKMVNAPAHKAGDTFLGDIRVTRSGADQGAIYFGTGLAFVYWDGVSVNINNPSGGGIRLAGDGQVFRPGATNTGYLYFSQAAGSPAIGFDGTDMIAIWPASHGLNNTGIIATKTNVCEFPLLGSCVFGTAANLAAAGARFATNTLMQGRLVVGAGASTATPGVSWTENTHYGTSWAPGSVLGVSDTIGVSGATGVTMTPDASNIVLGAVVPPNNATGATNVNTATHVHTATLTGGPATKTGSVAMTGTATNYIPPAYCVVWGVRIS